MQATQLSLDVSANAGPLCDKAAVLGAHIKERLLQKLGDRGGTVVKVLCYKSEDRWFDPSWCHWNFSFDIKSFRFDSACNRNEYQEHFLGVKAAGA